MDLKMESKHIDGTESTGLWPEVAPEDTASLKQAAEICQKHLETLRRNEEQQDDKDETGGGYWASHQFSEFNLWCVKVGVYGQGLRSLDVRLKDVPEICNLLRGLLESLKQDFEELQNPTEDSASSSNSSNDSDDAASDSSCLSFDSLSSVRPLHEDAITRGSAKACNGKTLRLRMHIQDTIDRLHAHALRIERAGAQHRRERIEAYFQNEHEGRDAYERFLELADAKARIQFPKATKAFQHRIAESFARRRSKFDYLKAHQKKRAVQQGKSEDSETIHPNPEPQHKVDFPPLVNDPEPGAKASLPSQHAPHDQQTVVAATEVTRLEMGTLQRQRRKAESVASVTTRPELPPAPPVKGTTFECPYCRLEFRAEEAENDRWTEHVLQDFEPYFCTFEGCKNPFDVPNSFDGLLGHLQSHLEERYYIDMPNEGYKELSKLEFEAYLNQKGEGSGETVNLLKETSRRRKGAFLFESCPFCGGYPDVVEMIYRNRDSPEAQKKLRHHIRGHMRDVCLFLPPYREDILDQGDDSSTAKLGSQITNNNGGEENTRRDLQAADQKSASDGILPDLDDEDFWPTLLVNFPIPRYGPPQSNASSDTQSDADDNAPQLNRGWDADNVLYHLHDPLVLLFDIIPARDPSTAGEFWQRLELFQESYSCFCIDRSTRSLVESPRRIRVALIDTGIDFDHPGIMEAKAKGRMKEEWCKSWVGATTKDYDDDLHGTNCAYLLHKAAPEADIYIARVFYKNELKLYEANNIAKAVQHATDIWNVDIICMAFGLGVLSPRVLRVPAPPLVFAAASNDGRKRQRTFPSRYKESIFCVYASEGNGEDSDLNPKMGRGFSLMTLGAGLEVFRKEFFIENGGMHCRFKKVEMSGTSFATPIAAGIAATILDLARRVEAINETGYLCGTMASLEEWTRMPAVIQGILENLTNTTPSYEYPEMEPNGLFEVTYEHPANEETCDDCDEAREITRRPRKTNHPRVHCGVIASGNQVIKDPVLRDRLGNDCICFEMEAAGLMNDSPCLVIRGVCDYADSHKNDCWQRYAAVAAAACAKEILQNIPEVEVEKEQLAREVVQAVTELSKDIKVLRQGQEGTNRKEFLDLLSPEDHTPKYHASIHMRQSGTGQWFLESAEFQAWKDPDVGIAYFFCEFNDREEQTTDKFLGSLLKQLLKNRSCFPDCLETLYEAYKLSKTSPMLKEVIPALGSVCNLYSTVYIVIDALDEFDVSGGRQTEFLNAIDDLRAQRTVNLFATSRGLMGIQNRFRGCTNLEIRAQDTDIGKYLSYYLPTLLGVISDDKRLQREAKDSIIGAVGGVFLLARLHANLLNGTTTPNGAREKLKALSESGLSYDEAYKSTMNRIQSQPSDFVNLAKRVLSWVSRAKRSLSVWELQLALAMSKTNTELDSGNLTPIKHIIASCAGLVVVHETGTEITSLAELSRYATHNWRKHAEGGYMDNKNLILRFVNNKDKVRRVAYELNLAHATPRSDEPELVRVSPLHLAIHWDLMELVNDLLKEGCDPRQEDTHGRNPLSWAAERGLDAMVKTLLDADSTIANARGQRGPGPTHISPGLFRLGRPDRDLRMSPTVYRKKLNSTKTVAQCGATPLWYAALNNHTAVVRRLLAEPAVDPDLPDLAYGTTPLWCASAMGSMEVVRELVKHDKVTLDIVDNYHDFTALSIATLFKQDDVASLLLEKGANINSISKDGSTPLIHARGLNRVAIAELPIRQPGVNIDAVNEEGNSAFVEAGSGNSEIAKQLLDKGLAADHVFHSRIGFTPLHLGVRYLQAVGVNPHFTEQESVRETALTRAAFRGDLASLRMLPISDADPNETNNCGDTALARAASEGHVEVVKLLLERGADPNIQNKYGKTALVHASLGGYEEMVEELLEKGADSNIQDGCGKTALILASICGYEEIVEKLLEHGADRYLIDKKGCTAKCYASEKGDETLVSILSRREFNDRDRKMLSEAFKVYAETLEKIHGR
ncbi:hypothetical protein NM208_g305 [Fusarium decemcellulare]|uniref:Uncharacterized protein n=1 Tax=Fusarium decemcellulare TaxID=57161 RepID=A0ACC1T084_9HYPO|nr:hypothetical protein NM208_g305 [Fusarium decemcellulare]